MSLHHSYNTAFRYTLALSIQKINSYLVLLCSETSKKFGIYSLNFSVGEVTSLVFENTLRNILGSKSEKIKNIEARNKFRYSCKKERRSFSDLNVMFAIQIALFWHFMQND